jgi:hypothetical protein
MGSVIFKTSNSTDTPIGQQCNKNDTTCANQSVCMEKIFEDNLVLNVCRCDPTHMNRVGNSCFVIPGHPCYFPAGDVWGRILLSCMPEAECRSSVNKSSLSSGYCMCKDKKDDEPFRSLNTEKEISRCHAPVWRSYYLSNMLPLLGLLFFN